MNKHKSAYIIEQVNKLKKKTHEILLIVPLLVDEELQDVRPFTQYFVQSDSATFFIDLYYPDLKIAIEIDESHHQRQQEGDVEREKVITSKENCTFKRVKIDENFEFGRAIKDIKDFIIKKREELKESKAFKEWTIKTFDISTAQTDYPNAIFFKATKPFDNGFDPTRGPMLIREDIRKTADTFVTISADTVTNVYSISPNNWVEFQDRQLGFIQQGNELANHPLLSSGTTKWNTTSNRILGTNLKE